MIHWSITLPSKVNISVWSGDKNLTSPNKWTNSAKKVMTTMFHDANGRFPRTSQFSCSWSLLQSATSSLKSRSNRNLCPKVLVSSIMLVPLHLIWLCIHWMNWNGMLYPSSLQSWYITHCFTIYTTERVFRRQNIQVEWYGTKYNLKVTKKLGEICFKTRTQKLPDLAVFCGAVFPFISRWCETLCLTLR
jgi:hypothetical protein